MVDIIEGEVGTEVGTEIVGEPEAPAQEPIAEEPVIVDPLEGLEPYTPPVREPDPMALIQDSVRKTVQETLAEMLKAPVEQKPADPVSGVESRVKQLEAALLQMTSQAAVTQETQKSQQILNTYVSNVTNSLMSANITPESEPMLYKAMNAELTAAVTMAERQLQRPLRPQETYQVLKNFQAQWEPELTARGIGKPRSVTTTVTPSNQQFGQPQSKVAPNNIEALVKQIQETDDLDSLIKMGIRPTPGR